MGKIVRGGLYHQLVCLLLWVCFSKMSAALCYLGDTSSPETGHRTHKACRLLYFCSVKGMRLDPNSCLMLQSSSCRRNSTASRFCNRYHMHKASLRLITKPAFKVKFAVKRKSLGKGRWEACNISLYVIWGNKTF